MSIQIDSTGSTVVDTEYHWLTMDDCPKGAKVRVISPSGVCVDTILRSETDRASWIGWVPSPTFCKDTALSSKFARRKR